MKKNNLLITFDYELFLGKRSGRPENCVIQPTHLLNKLLSKAGIHAIFFVDTTYLCKLRELSATYPDCEADFKLIATQLVDLADRGHYVFPHIHPHWLDAVYLPEKREFDLSNITRYRFNSLTKEEQSKVFDDSMEILQEILLKKHPHYKIDAFRAGGWCIQPFDEFKPQFEKHNIKYDMSVIGGMYQFSNAQHFDFTTSPTKFIYRFNNDVCREDTEGKFIQLSGSVIDIPRHIDILHRLHRKFINKTGGGKEYGNGQGQVPISNPSVKPILPTGYNIFDRGHEFGCLERLSVIKLPTYRKHLEKTHYLHLISHPKLLNPHQIKTLRHLIDYANKDNKAESDYKVISATYLKG